MNRFPGLVLAALAAAFLAAGGCSKSAPTEQTKATRVAASQPAGGAVKPTSGPASRSAPAPAAIPPCSPNTVR